MKEYIKDLAELLMLAPVVVLVLCACLGVQA